MQAWQLQDAKNRLSQLVRDAASNGPQLITSHGREAAVVLSPEDYHALIRPKTPLVEFFRTSPWVGLDVDLTRGEGGDGVLDL